MYLIGSSIEHRTGAQHMLQWAIRGREKLVTNAEVLQEIIHRYVAIDRREAIQPAFDALLGVVDEVYPVTREDVERAKAIVYGRRPLSARAAIHLATMERHGISRVMTFDSGFDAYPGVSRVEI